VISKYLLQDGLRLSPAVYEMVLHHFLQEDNPAVFLAKIREWPPTLYSTSVMLTAVNDRLKSDPGNPVLMEALAELYGLPSPLTRAHPTHSDPEGVQA
jgi:hypothetical protein